MEKLVRVHEQFVGQRRADFKKLKAAEFIGMLHLRPQRIPVIDQLVAISLGKNIFAKESIYCFCRRE